MKALVRIMERRGQPTVMVTPQPATDEERAQVEAVAAILPLTFTLPYVAVASIAEDAQAIVSRQVRLMWDSPHPADSDAPRPPVR
ncbi:hypothetical protein [uncultured Bradyrhizobium sp.]|uniref:hypothetical protein n=1 Tax=uncultured Bradyrhizobium sp. TaxID=199684 RepID=UPI0026133A64|nr:hypothetical protein [uncultured Bradyrhizobium sp.]